jgi:hypothetical protein
MEQLCGCSATAKIIHRTLWADAVCICQDNLEEKSHQVALMTEIYSRADKVLVHLGDGDGASDAAMDCVKDFESVVSMQDALLVGRLFERPWFTRMWVSEMKCKAYRQGANTPFAPSGSTRSCTFSSGYSHLWHILCGMGLFRSLAVPSSPSHSYVTKAISIDLPTHSNISTGFDRSQHSQLCFRLHA